MGRAKKPIRAWCCLPLVNHLVPTRNLSLALSQRLLKTSKIRPGPVSQYNTRSHKKRQHPQSSRLNRYQREW